MGWDGERRSVRRRLLVGWACRAYEEWVHLWATNEPIPRRDILCCEIHSYWRLSISALRKSDTNQRTRSAFTLSSARFSQPLSLAQRQIDA